MTVSHNVFDYDVLWKSLSTRTTSSAFPLSELLPLDKAYLYLVTCYHCVNRSKNIMVRLPDTSEHIQATLVVAAPHMDVALIQIPRSKNCVSLERGTADVGLGENVFACGYGNGASHITMTLGVVSGRESALQFDSAVNGGNSGGPLVNSKDEVVGLVMSSRERRTPTTRFPSNTWWACSNTFGVMK